jgi:hypothetical protein
MVQRCRKSVEDDKRDSHPRSHLTNDSVEKVRKMVHLDRPHSQPGLLCGIVKRLRKALHRKGPEL